MKYNEFFSKFYMGRNAGGIINHKSKEKIPEYLVKAGLKEAFWSHLPLSGSTYGKWFEGSRKPDGNLWGLITSEFDEEQFIENLTRDLNDSAIEQIMIKFRIERQAGEDPDKRLLAFALAKQFYAIAAGNGEAADIARDYYKPSSHIISFPQYAARALEKYSKTRIPFSDEEERGLEDIYVCNSLSKRARARNAGNNRLKESTINNATLAVLADYSKKIVLVANGGMGKSMMLQHLFVDSLKQHVQSGILPVLIELRNFSAGKDLIADYIVKAVERFDGSFTEKKAKDLMTSGKCQLLLDAADEIDLSDANAFQRQLSELVDRYPYNQYIVASRECNMMKSIRGFAKLYLQPFSEEQADALIQNLLPDENDEELRQEILQYVDGDFIKRHRAFATNPMLLTFIIMKYPIDRSFRGERRLFYRTAYDTLVKLHDEEKEAYDRIYHSAKDSEEFTKVFREFCAITYIDRIHEFDQATFEGYFNRLTSKDGLYNPKVMTMKNFIHDACATACMMYEENLMLLYIDPGFQEYLFAEHNYLLDVEKMIEVGKALWDVPVEAFEGFDAFEMLCECSLEKVEAAFFIPYLNEIFKGKADDDAFVMFLKYGYRELDYQVVDSTLVGRYMKEKGAEWQPLKQPVAEPCNIIFSMILKQEKISGLLSLAVSEQTLDYPAFMTAGIFGEDYFDSVERKKKVLARRLLRLDIDDLPKYERTHNVERFVRDGEKQLVCFGHEYKADLSIVAQEKEQYRQLIQVLKTEDEAAEDIFRRVKTYYETLKKKYKGEQFS